jgi:hypothetical protein
LDELAPVGGRTPGRRDGWRFEQLTEPRTVPPGLFDEFGDDPVAKRLWREFLTHIQLVNEPTDFAEITLTVRERLWPTIMAAGRPNS